MATDGASGVLALIATYRPGPALVERIRSITSMVDDVMISDDASPCTADPILREAGNGVQLLRFDRNAGIARSLNAGLQRAVQLHLPWLLTLDQDTILGADHVAQLIACSHLWQRDQTQPLGVIGPEVLRDTDGALAYPTKADGALLRTAEVFQSGALWSVSALTQIGGFDETLGIDAVDAAACLALRRHGYAVLLAPGLTIEHGYGSGRAVRILGRTVRATGHSSQRRTTMVRNRLRLAPAEFRESPMQGLRSLRRLAVNTALAVTVEENRWAKAKASLRGLWPER
ncbi:MAG: glycosyltransferase [Actinomycetales bacterium]